MRTVKKPAYKREFIWCCYAIAAYQVIHYYFWDHEQNIGILFGALGWLIAGKAAMIVRCFFISQIYLQGEIKKLQKEESE